MESHEDIHVMILKVVTTQSSGKLVRASPSTCRSLAPGPDATTAFTTVTTINHLDRREVPLLIIATQLHLVIRQRSPCTALYLEHLGLSSLLTKKLL